MINNDRLVFLLNELIKHKDDVIQALDIALWASDGDDRLTGKQSAQLEKLLEEMAPYVDSKYKARVGNLLHFPGWTDAEEILTRVLDEMSIVPFISSHRKIELVVSDINPLLFDYIPFEYLQIMRSLISKQIEYFYNYLRNKGAFSKLEVIDMHLLNGPLKNEKEDAEYILKVTRQTVAEIDVTPLKDNIRKTVLEQYAPYEGY